MRRVITNVEFLESVYLCWSVSHNFHASHYAHTPKGPSYKRGPPKGYIHAIEQRWHHVEAVLGSILSSHDPRAQSLINDLRKDDLAREILNRVDVGPFVRLFYLNVSSSTDNNYQGPAGRIRSSGRVDSLSSLLLGGRGEGHASHASKEGRSRRQSRVSREIVSSSQGSIYCAFLMYECR